MDYFFTLEKLQRRMRELESFRMMEAFTVTPFAAMADTLGSDAVHTTLPSFIPEFEMNLGDHFNGRDRYLWLHKKLTLPEKKPGTQVMGHFDFGKTGGGHNSGFESLLYVNNQPFQGVDSNHQEVIFYDLEGAEVDLLFMLWTGLEGGGKKTIQQHQIKQAKIGYLHETTDNLYYYAKAIVKTLERLPNELPEKYQLQEILNTAFLKIDWDEQRFYDTVDDAYQYVVGMIQETNKTSLVTVNCVGHTHIDVAWLWRLKHTREKAMRSFSTVLNLMKEFKDYYFLQSQPQLYRYIKEDAPEIFEKIKEKVQQGQWEADGGMWVEADCNISSGEALSRQFLYGIQFMKKELNTDCTFLWLPDVFGYSWALPQILKLCNIKSFVTTKISWNQYNSMPHDLFWWRGIDGSEILTYFITTPELNRPMDDRFATYNGMISPRSVLGTWNKFKDKELTNDVLISYGYGDGGGGVNRNMLKMRQAMDQLPGLPKVRTTTVKEFLAQIHHDVEHTQQYVHTWDGELYLEYHRGTYTTQAENKRWNRLLEFALAKTEWISALAYLEDVPYPTDQIRTHWETLLRNQFHDIIPGSSIREVYEDSIAEYEATFAQLETLKEKALDAIVETKEDCYTLWNFGSFQRTEAILIRKSIDGTFFDENGTVLESTFGTEGHWVKVTMAPLCSQTIFFKASVSSVLSSVPFDVCLDDNKISTPFYDICWDAQGALCHIWDKENKREVLHPNGRGNVFEIFEDKPMNYDAWDIDIFYTEKRTEVILETPWAVVDKNIFQLTLGATYVYNNSKVAQKMIFYRDCRRIDFDTTVHWYEKDKLLKVSFETGIRSTKASYDIQYGFVERPTHFNTTWDLARFEVVGHRWADLSDTSYGVSLLNNCKYGYSIKDGTMKLTLLKSSKYPDTDADMGVHHFVYALLPHQGTVAQGNTIEEATALNLPIDIQPDKLHVNNKQIVLFDHNAIAIDAIKKHETEDCLVLRFHEIRGSQATVVLSSAYNVTEWVPCNILEEAIAPGLAGNNITIQCNPFEIKNYKLYFR